jgi:HSP20 family protein
VRYQRVAYRFAVTSLVPPSPPAQVVLAPATWKPNADVAETEEAFEVFAELAGVEEDDLEIVLFENGVVLRGRRRHPEPNGAGIFHSAEIHLGRFRLDFAFRAAIDVDAADATLRNGMLRVRLPKAAPRSLV